MVIRITTHRANSLSNKTLSRLLELTIDASRGDYVDDGDRNFTVESVLADILSERIAGLKPFNKKAHIVCARIGAKIVGWALIGPAWLINRTGVMLYIDPEHRRHGLGNKIIDASKEIARSKFKSDRLVAAPWNASSRSFFVRNGFVSDRNLLPSLVSFAVQQLSVVA